MTRIFRWSVVSAASGLARAMWPRSVPNGPASASRSSGMWLASSPSGPCVTRVASGKARIRPCRAAVSVSAKCLGRYIALHPENAELGFFGRGVHRGRQAKAEYAAGIGRVDDAVVPQASRGVVGVALGFILLADRRLEGGFFLGRPGLAGGFDAVALDRGQHAGRLFAPHHRDARVRPHPQEAWRVGTAAHAVVAGTEAAADDHGEFRHLGGSDGRHHLGAIAGKAAVFVLLADHEAGDVLPKDERNAALGAQLDEMR